MDINTIGVIVLTGAITSLITFFVKTISNTKMSELDKEQKTKIEQLEKDVQVLKQGQVYVITRLGGNPAEHGLL